jgi:cytochrome-b5 reductase
LDEDLTEFEKAGKLSYLPVVQNPDENWMLAKGRITSEMIQHFMPFNYGATDDSLVMVCGPPELKKSIAEITAGMALNVFYFN